MAGSAERTGEPPAPGPSRSAAGDPAAPAARRLLRAAAADFAEHGYGNTGSDRSAGGRDVEGDLYEHFANKEACILALFDQASAVLAASMASAARGGQRQPPRADASRHARLPDSGSPSTGLPRCWWRSSGRGRRPPAAGPGAGGLAQILDRENEMRRAQRPQPRFRLAAGTRSRRWGRSPSWSPPGPPGRSAGSAGSGSCDRRLSTVCCRWRERTGPRWRRGSPVPALPPPRRLARGGGPGQACRLRRLGVLGRPVPAFGDPGGPGSWCWVWPRRRTAAIAPAGSSR